MKASGMLCLPVAVLFSLGGLAGAAMAAPAGESVFQSACIACHGVDGAGALPGVPDLTSSDSRLAQPEDVLLKLTIEGFQRPGSSMAMPPRAGNPELSDEDLRAALRYMRERFGTR